MNCLFSRYFLVSWDHDFAYVSGNLIFLCLRRLSASAGISLPCGGYLGVEESSQPRISFSRAHLHKLGYPSRDALATSAEYRTHEVGCHANHHNHATSLNSLRICLLSTRVPDLKSCFMRLHRRRHRHSARHEPNILARWRRNATSPARPKPFAFNEHKAQR